MATQLLLYLSNVTQGGQNLFPKAKETSLDGLGMNIFVDKPSEYSLVTMTSMYDVIDLMDLGPKNHVVRETALNDRSNRSHSLRDLTSGVVLRGCLHLVDLAGSKRVEKSKGKGDRCERVEKSEAKGDICERVKKSKAKGDRLKAAQHINKSLSALFDVISSLAQNNLRVPYRNNKLTQLLQDSVGQSQILIDCVELSAAQVHKDSSDVKDLKEQIANIKLALTKIEGDQDGMHQKVSGSPSGKLSLRSPPNLHS
ncbi:kinesin-like protein KIN-14I isoform X1 [Tanacetum coccineum]